MESFSDVDEYIEAATLWPDEIRALRPMLLDAGLDEAIKWGKPCYSHNGENLAIMQEMKGFLALLFTKGALIPDPAGLLRKQGPNTHGPRRLCLTSTAEINELSETINAYVAAAKVIIDTGAELEPAPPEQWASELQDCLNADPALKEAFDALTPGRRREYNIYFTGAKQSSTRRARVEKCLAKIRAGKGFRDR